MNFVMGESEKSLVRSAAVAGQFYPSDVDSLKREVQQFLGQGQKLLSYPSLMICPHAGYVFSGLVAAKAYATINKNIKTVFLIGPSHHEWFSGICIVDAHYYQTPLGNVPVALDVIAKLRKSSLVHTLPAADALEHCLEVQLPFLQTVLSSFTIVPIITGKVDPAEIAKLLYPFLDESTLVIASSDLSHYHRSSEAKSIDAKSIQTIMTGNTDGFIDACGETAIRTIMHCALKCNLTPKLLDARNSFETAPQYGSQNRVVGYASIVYVKKNQ